MPTKTSKGVAVAQNPRGGPATAEGREVVSYNATRHGLRSGRVLPWESQDEHDAMHAAVAEYLVPADEVEAEIVRGFAGALWRLRRVEQAEALHIEKCMHSVRTKRERMTDPTGARTVPLSPEGFSVHDETFLVGAGGTYLTNIAAYEVSLQRSGRRWLEMLEKLRKLRGGECKE